MFNIMMALPVYGLYRVLTLFMSTESRIQSIFIIMLCAAVGGVIYVFLGLRSKLVDRLFGARVEKIRRKLTKA